VGGRLNELAFMENNELKCVNEFNPSKLSNEAELNEAEILERSRIK